MGKVRKVTAQRKNGEIFEVLITPPSPREKFRATPNELMAKHRRV